MTKATAGKAVNPISANRVRKEQMVVALGDEVKEAGLVVVTQQLGLDADETRNLRVQLHKENVGLKVGKNTLIKMAIKGTRLAVLEKFLHGPTALAYSKDPIAAAKATVEFARKNEKLKIIGAAMGDKLLDEAETRRWPACRGSISCAPRSSVFCRRRPPRLPVFCRRPRASWRALPRKRSRGNRLWRKSPAGDR